MLIRPLSTASQIISLISLVRVSCLSVPAVLCFVATRFLIHRHSSVNSVDEFNAADDVPLCSALVEYLHSETHQRECVMPVTLSQPFSLDQRRTPPKIPALLSTTEMSDGRSSLTCREFPPPM